MKKEISNEISNAIPHYFDLHRYCCMLTGTKWDGEDLLQETVIKVLKRFTEQNRDKISKAYLFRIATNTWIDQCRKNKIAVEAFDEGLHSQTEELSDGNVSAAIERLVHHLKPKSAAIILLVDVFRFTTKETAEMLGDMYEGAVKTALRRARAKLASVDQEENERFTQHAKVVDVHKLIGEFTSAIRNQEPFAIIQAYKSLKSMGIHVERKKEENRIFFTFTDPEGNILMVSDKMVTK